MHLTQASYPATRFRRNRRTDALRRLTQETAFGVNDLIWPVFIQEDAGSSGIATMPGVQRHSTERLLPLVEQAARMGIPAVCLFPYTDPSARTETCEMAWHPDNLVNRTIRAIKDAVPEMAVMTDIALDPFNIHGQDGLMRDGIVLNDETIDALVKMALSQAEAGADILGPSDMMDGRIGRMRMALEDAGHQGTSIMSYSAKYASVFYGSFRDAVGASAVLKGDKKTYQMNPGNTDEALRLVARDLTEGADSVMVKPGMPYLDVCRRVKDEFGVPTFAYQVSGEYAMLKGAMTQGWLDPVKGMAESLLAFKRAGCDGVLTYFAPEMAKHLRDVNGTA